MSKLLVDQSGVSSGSSTGSFADVPDLAASSIVVASASNVILMVATVPLLHDANTDESADFQFAVDDVVEGPRLTAFAQDSTNEGCGRTICYARTGLSGSHKFALRWITRGAAAAIDTGHVKEMQVIEITNSSLLVNSTSFSTDAAVSGYTDILNMEVTPNVTAGSKLLLLANMTPADTGADSMASYQFTVGGTAEGPETAARIDSTDELCGMSMMWLTDGQSGSTVFDLQWDEQLAAVDADTSGTYVRYLQVIEITANANILANETNLDADDLTASYTDVLGLTSGVVTVDSTDSILIFAATVVPTADVSDEVGMYRFADGGTGEGPETDIFKDDVNEVCGHSPYYAVTGKSAGSHTFTLQGFNVAGTVSLSTARKRSFCVLELTAAAAADAGQWHNPIFRVKPRGYGHLSEAA